MRATSTVRTARVQCEPNISRDVFVARANGNTWVVIQNRHPLGGWVVKPHGGGQAHQFTSRDLALDFIALAGAR